MSSQSSHVPINPALLNTYYPFSERAALSPAEFRRDLRNFLLASPSTTLRQVAGALGVTRQRVSVLVGKLGRPNCARPGSRLAPEKEKARKNMVELVKRVRAGIPAVRAAKDLGVSLTAATSLGFRAKKFNPPHGTRLRAKGDEGMTGCNCWRCRRAAGIALPRGPRTGAARQAAVLDWLAWVDPDTKAGLGQAEIGKLVGVAQSRVSRIARREAE